MPARDLDRAVRRVAVDEDDLVDLFRKAVEHVPDALRFVQRANDHTDDFLVVRSRGQRDECAHDEALF
jgi:ribosomal protein S2